jgi:hypothetical protein
VQPKSEGGNNISAKCTDSVDGVSHSCISTYDVADDCVHVERDLTNPEQRRPLRISKRTNKPVRKYECKVKHDNIDVSLSVDFDDPKQSAAFMAHINSLVKKIARASDIRDITSAS